jgi:thioredoxin reductase (NADPH)
MRYDIAVIGTGPAGVSAAVTAKVRNKSVLLLGSGELTGKLVAGHAILNYPGLPGITGDGLADALRRHLEAMEIAVTEEKISAVYAMGDYFALQGRAEVPYEAAAVIVACGVTADKPLPGEEENLGHGVSYCATCDGPFFRKKKILVCGGGDSACQESMYLRKLSDDVTVTHRRDRFRAQASIVKAMTDAGIKTKMNTTVQSINSENNKVRSVTFLDKTSGETYTEEFDGVFIFVGNIPQTQLVPDCEKDEAGFIKTDARMMTSIPGIYAIGDVRATPFRQIVTAAADGAVAAHYASEYIDERNNNAY